MQRQRKKTDRKNKEEQTTNPQKKIRVTGKDIISCYGKFNCDPEKQKVCRWKDACYSFFHEDAENIHFQREHTLVGYMSYDAESIRESERDEYRTEEDGQTNNTDESESIEDDSTAGHITKDILQYFGAIDVPGEEKDLELAELTIPANSIPSVHAVLQRLAVMHEKTPNVLQALFSKVFKRMKQADIAREMCVSRQCVNKVLQRELGIAQKKNDIQERRDRELAEAKQKLNDEKNHYSSLAEAFLKMTKNESVIYHICGEDGVLSVTSIQKITGLSRPTIYKTLHNLNAKYGISLHILPYHRKKSKKNDPRNH